MQVDYKNVVVHDIEFDANAVRPLVEALNGVDPDEIIKQGGTQVNDFIRDLVQHHTGLNISEHPVKLVGWRPIKETKTRAEGVTAVRPVGRFGSSFGTLANIVNDDNTLQVRYYY